MFKSFNKTVISSNSTVFDKVFKKTSDLMDDISETIEEAFKEGNSHTVTTDHMNVKISEKEIIINGDVESITFNGKVIHKSEK